MPTLSERYALARWPRPPTILGARLQPLALGHALLLAGLDSRAFGEGDRESFPPARGDLALALLVCSRSPTSAAWWLSPGVALLAKLWLRARVALMSEAAFLVALDQWRAYLLAALQLPPYSSTGQPGEAAGLPYWLAVKTILMTEFGLSEAAALEYPVAAARWEILAWQELHGRVTLVNEDLLAAADEERARVAALSRPPSSSASPRLSGESAHALH